jgi:copper chaperone
VEENMTHLKIEGMSCNNCVRHVTQALKSVPGVEQVEVLLQEGRAQVTGTAPVEKLIEAVQEEGYTARVESVVGSELWDGLR